MVTSGWAATDPCSIGTGTVRSTTEVGCDDGTGIPYACSRQRRQDRPPPRSVQRPRYVD
uniref:Uncharacterized protein n=1 Tax=Hyaloperonospora arabidopsidis (strain Emoy2) TaxID=559515 RepID=M4BSP8_HYAAE